MFSLRLQCPVERTEEFSLVLWDAGTVAISETPAGAETVLLAGFDDETAREMLLRRFEPFDPDWALDTTDWIAHTENRWPARTIGNRLFLAPPWNRQETPAGRLRVIHNPGMASGTGEHPCTQLALAALERCITPGSCVLDVGTGSGVLAIAAAKLGAAIVVALDPDEAALSVARANHRLNTLADRLVCGSADCICNSWATTAVANISGTVLMAILDDLMRVSTADGTLILTGFRNEERAAFLGIFPDAVESHLDGWSCLQISLT